MRNIFVKITLAVIYLFSLFPLKVHYFFSGIIRFILKDILKYRYSTIVTNLSRSFPELKYNDIKKLTDRYYVYMCDLFAETLWDYGHSRNALRKRLSVEGEDIITEAQKSVGRVMIVLGHCGNCEYVGAFIGACSDKDKDGFSRNPVYTIYKAAENKFFDRIVKAMRESDYKKFKMEGSLLESNEVARHTLTHKEEQSVYMLIADQNPTGPHPQVVTFLNQPTMMLRGPEFLSAKNKMAVVYMYMDRIGRGKFKCSCELITLNAANEEPGFVTKRFAELLERDINSNRINWLWSHKRWKRDIPTNQQ